MTKTNIIDLLLDFLFGPKESDRVPILIPIESEDELLEREKRRINGD